MGSVAPRLIRADPAVVVSIGSLRLFEPILRVINLDHLNQVFDRAAKARVRKNDPLLNRALDRYKQRGTGENFTSADSDAQP